MGDWASAKRAKRRPPIPGGFVFGQARNFSVIARSFPGILHQTAINSIKSPPVKKLFLPVICLLAAGLLPCGAETIVALYSNNRLRQFDSDSPESFTQTVEITGIAAAEQVVALDFDGDELVVVSRKGTTINFYRVDLGTGVATKPPTSSANWSGTGFGFDYVPNSSTRVLVSDADKLHVITGGQIGFAPQTVAYDNVTSDGDPVDQHAGDNPAIVALAFTNDFPGSEATVLYGIDATPNSLAVVTRSTGQLDTVGPLGVAVGTRCGFDISGATGTAYAAFGSGDFTTLYKVNLGTGEATSVGSIGGQLVQAGVNVVDIAVVPPAPPAPPAAPDRLLNISTRTRVGTGEDVMIAGFIAGGDAPSRLIIRGLGPSLASAGIASPLPDPSLEIYDANGVIAANNNWKSDQESEITASQLAPTDNREAAFIGTFAPGGYTAILSDANGSTGVGIIEVYRLEN